jgi:uncharacterized membrane protein YbhN (UPF0104 family)
MVSMRTLRIVLFSAGALILVALVYRLGAGSIASALHHVAWWQFALICLVHTLNVVVDASGWRYTLPPDRAPFWKLVAARCAGDSVNVLSAVAAVGGEAVKAWVLKRDVPYEESVPSLIISKTAEVVAQVLLLAVGLALAMTTHVVGHALRTAMVYLLVVEVIGVGGFLGVQVAGLVGRAGRLIRTQHVERLDEALRGFYRHEWPRFLAAVALYFVGWLLGAVQGFLILDSLGLPASLVSATIIEALWSAVRFTTFYIPASLGTLEGATAAAFTAFGFRPGAGLAFTLVRRASQAVWIGLGAVALMALHPDRRSGDLAPAGVREAAGAREAVSETLGGV